MNSSEVLQELDLLADMTPTEKKLYLSRLITDTTFSRVIKFALDPFITFGINKIEEPVISGTSQFDVGTWELLEHLASRVLTGNRAKDRVNHESEKLDEDSAELLWRILTKDLRCGVTAKTVNSAKAGFIPTFECQLAHKYDQKHITKWPVVVEPKYDGVRALLILEHSGAKFVSRTGKTFAAVQWLANEIYKWVFVDREALLTPMSGMVIDGELVDPEGSFYKVSGDARGKLECRSLHFMAFDILPLIHFKKGHDPSPYLDRRMSLNVWVDDIDHKNVLKAPSWLAINDQEVMEYYNGVRRTGGEGVIVKPTDGDYRCTRSRNWLKIKDLQSVDVVITGMEEGTGKYKGMLGAVIVDMEGVDVRVGSGFSDEQRKGLWEEFLSEVESPVGELIEVEYHEKTPDGSLRHPRFIRFREDKPVEDGVGV